MLLHQILKAAPFFIFLFITTLSQAADLNSILPTTDNHLTKSIDAGDPAAVRTLVSHMSDHDVRTLLIERLDLYNQDNGIEQPEKYGFVSLLNDSGNGVFRSVGVAFDNFPTTIKFVSTIYMSVKDSVKPVSLILVLIYSAIAICLGLFARLAYCKLTISIQYYLDKKFIISSLYGKALVIFFRLLIAILSVYVFTYAALSFIELVLTESSAFLASVIIKNIAALSLTTFVFFDVFLGAPTLANRLLKIDDRHARFLLRHVTLLATFIGFMSAWFTLSNANGLAKEAVPTGFWLNLAVFIYFIFIAWRGHEGFSDLLRHAEDTSHEHRIAAVYPFFIITVIVFTWFLVQALAGNNLRHLILDGRHYVFMALLIWAPAMDSAIRAVVHHIQPPISGVGLAAEKAYTSNKRSYIRIGRLILTACVFQGVLDIWDLNFIEIASHGLGSQFVVRLVDTLWIALAGYLLWEIVTLSFNRKIAAEQTATGVDLEEVEFGGEGGGAGGSRLSTVLPLLRWTAQTVISATTILVAFAKIGIDTTPLLAGAGVVGLAIGFGAQKLVTDVVSGIFFLIDDAFRAGEYIDIEGTVGTVEKISLRSMQLRHHRGPVHTIPYGEIPKITNYSRDWVIMKLRFTVPFDTDIHKVKKIFKKIGQEIMQVPEFADDLIQPFKSQGVLEVDDVGMVIRGKFMTKPGKQFTLRKEIYQRVHRAFEDNGLQFARKEVRVKLDGLTEDTVGDDSKHSITAADAAEPIK